MTVVHSDEQRAAGATWHYKKDGATLGPVPHAELCALFARRQLSLDTEVLREGSPDWVRASTVEDFRGVWGRGFVPAGRTPPPIPGAVVKPQPAGGRPTLTGELDGHHRLPDLRWSEAPQVRPWVRYFARWLDNSLLMTAASLVYFPTASWERIAMAYLLLPLAAFTIYPLQLALFGRTLGKAYFGISVENEQGRRPTFGQAIVREWRVLLHGMGVGIFIVPLVAIFVGFAFLTQVSLQAWMDGWPAVLLVVMVLGALFILFLPLFTMYAGYRRLREDGVTSWDRVGELAVRHRPAPVRICLFSLTLGTYLAIQFGPFVIALVLYLVPPRMATAPACPPARPEKGEVVVTPQHPAPASRRGSSAQAGTPDKPRPKPKRLTLPEEPNANSN